MRQPKIELVVGSKLSIVVNGATPRPAASTVRELRSVSPLARSSVHHSHATRSLVPIQVTTVCCFGIEPVGTVWDRWRASGQTRALLQRTYAFSSERMCQFIATRASTVFRSVNRNFLLLDSWAGQNRSARSAKEVRGTDFFDF